MVHAMRIALKRRSLVFVASLAAGLFAGAPAALASTLNVSFPPTSEVGQQVTITASGETDTNDCNSNDGCGIDVYLVPPGGYCASNEDDVSGENGAVEVIGYNPPFGNYSTSALPVPFTAPGTWSVCGFLYSDYSGGWDWSNDLQYTTGSIQVSEPPPARCVVPSYAGLTERQMIRRLLGAHCTGGEIIPVRSRLRRGQVVRLGDRPGTQLAHGTEVTIYVSRGERRRRRR